MRPLRDLFNSSLIKNRRRWLVIFLFGGFLALRLYHLGFHDFWYDEAITVNYAKQPWGQWNVPLYYIVLHFWVKVFGISEFSLRFPSAVFNFGAVILTFFLGKSLFNKKIGIIASIFIGLSPFNLWYAQEARDYSMALFIGTLSSYLLYRSVKEERNKLWLYFTAISALGLYTNYFYIFLFLAQGAYLLFSKRRKLSFKETLYFLFIPASFLPFLPKFLKKFYFVWQGFWIPRPAWGSLLVTLENFNLGYNGSFWLYLISDILAGIFFIWAFWNARRHKLTEALLFCIFLLFIPIICAFCFSKIFFSVYLDRGLIIFSPYYFLILSFGLAYLNRGLKIFLCVIGISMVFISDYRYFNDFMPEPLIHHMGTYIKKPVKPIVKFLENSIAPQEDTLVFTNVSTIPSIGFYSRNNLRAHYYFFNPRFPHTNTQRPIIDSKFNVPLQKINSLHFQRLWVIACDWARSGKLDENSRSVKDWLDRNLRLEFTKEFDGLWVSRYVRD